MRPAKIVTTILLFGLFLAAKGMSYHSLSHSGDSDTVQCEICDHALLYEITPFDTATPPSFPADFTIISMYQFSDTLKEAIFEDPSFPALFGRPPPFAPALTNA